MLLRKLVVVGLVGFLSCAVNIAAAQEASAPGANSIGFDGVSFADTASPNRLRLDINDNSVSRFANLDPTPYRERVGRSRDAGYEVELVARGAAGFDVSVAQRGGVGFGASGDIERETRSSELRLGRGLQQMRDAPSMTPTWYFFAASEDEALIWRPGGRNSFGGASPGFAMQDRVEIGDLQAGVTYEVNGFQASLAYVEREISFRSGARSVTQDERFAGLTLTMRR